MLTYEEYQVQPWLALFVKKLWRLTFSVSASLTVGKRSILPNGCFTVAVIRRAGLTVTHQGKVLPLTAGVYYCGQLTQALQVEVLPGTQATMVQLYPWTPVHFTLLDGSAYTNCIIPIAQLPLESVRLHRLLPDLSLHSALLKTLVLIVFLLK